MPKPTKLLFEYYCWNQLGYDDKSSAKEAPRYREGCFNATSMPSPQRLDPNTRATYGDESYAGITCAANSASFAPDRLKSSQTASFLFLRFCPSSWVRRSPFFLCLLRHLHRNAINLGKHIEEGNFNTLAAWGLTAWGLAVRGRGWGSGSVSGWIVPPRASSSHSWRVGCHLQCCPPSTAHVSSDWWTLHGN